MFIAHVRGQDDARLCTVRYEYSGAVELVGVRCSDRVRVGRAAERKEAAGDDATVQCHAEVRARGTWRVGLRDR